MTNSEIAENIANSIDENRDVLKELRKIPGFRNAELDAKLYVNRKKPAGQSVRTGGDMKAPTSDSTGKKLTKDQSKFFANSAARDGKGQLLRLYHGSRSDLFTEFEMFYGVWMTPDRAYAEVYAEQWHSWRDDFPDTAGGRANLTGLEQDVYSDPDFRMYEMYANIENPVELGEINGDLSDGKVREIASSMGIRYSELKAIADNYMEEYTYMLTRSHEFMELCKKHGFDGLHATEKGKETWCAIITPDQVKLTRNENPTRNPDVRFSLKRGDEDYMTAVESGNMARAQKLVDKAANEAGYTRKLYHGTDAFGFTEIDMERSAA